MMTWIFVVAWDLWVALMLAHDIRTPGLQGPFNVDTIRPGCHWRVAYGTNSNGMPFSAVWSDVLCYQRGTLEAIQ